MGTINGDTINGDDTIMINGDGYYFLLVKIRKIRGRENKIKNKGTEH